MISLQQRFEETSDFLLGVELVSTRGPMFEERAIKTRRFAAELAEAGYIDWVSITDNAGGNPMLAPAALGKPILYAGKEVVIHLSCKDFNRNGLESQAWQLASEGFHNILALSGDYPVTGHAGNAKPVFDIDSVGLIALLKRMNSGLDVNHPRAKASRRLSRTTFFVGAVVTNFKLREAEVIPQYLKLDKKIECGARFIINQIGYDARKMHELLVYLRRRGTASVPVIGNVYALNPRVAGLFAAQKIPGVVVSDELLEICRQQGRSPDKGKAFFLELAAKQIAVYRGLGYRGAYLGGLHASHEIERVLELEKSFARDDWKQFAGEIRYSRPGEFFMMAEDPATGLADPDRLHPAYEASLQNPPRPFSVGYAVSKRVHDAMFTPGTRLHDWGARLYARSSDPRQGPGWLRAVELLSKQVMFRCHDCGDCSLPEIAFLCPESQCAKNQRNGPCGGTRDGLCEVDDFECIWSRAYTRLKGERRELELVDHAPTVQDQSLRGTSSWGNALLQRDHHGKNQLDSGASASGRPTEAAAEEKHPGSAPAKMR